MLGNSPTKANKILLAMPPTSTLKRRKQTPKRGVRKTLGGAGRKCTQTDANDENVPVVTPYKWSTNTTKEKQTRSGPKTISTRASAFTNDTDDSANTTNSEEEEEDSVEVAGTVTKNTRDNLTQRQSDNSSPGQPTSNQHKGYISKRVV
jgi:hypothetical protein